MSTYTVSDRTQIADVDPSMIIEEDDEEEQPCPICGDDDNEDRLLQCDGCDAYYHTYCMGLDDVPSGDFFCEECETQRAIEASCPSTSIGTAPTTHHTRATQRFQRTAERRTRGQQRRINQRNQASSSNWARVWQSVWDNLNFDLDFPFDDGAEAARIDRSQRASSERGGLRQWERRLHIAQQQGSGNTFRDTAPKLLDIAPEQAGVASPESREEIRAWNAFEKAKEIELDPAPRRKRKSVTASPSDADPVPQPQRPLKRPRTRRTMEQIEASSSGASLSTGSRRSSAAGPSSSRPFTVNHAGTQNNGPSFLQSMLREIATSSAPDETKGSSHYLTQSVTNHSSPQPSSPGASPTSSNHASPRARSTTPPPSLSTRPGSPLGLTSKVEPIFPPPEFSPTRSPLDTSLAYRLPHDSQLISRERRVSRHRHQGSSPPTSKDTSPARVNMPLSLKSDLQKMVTAALKPFYHSNAVSKDQYTDINRNVCHMLYDRVGENGSINEENKEIYEQVAREEVKSAVNSLKAAT